MAQLIVFQYRPGATLLHRFDPRVKLLLLLAMTGLAGAGGHVGLAATACVVIGGMMLLHISLWDLMLRMRVLLVICVLIVVVRTLSAEAHKDGLLQGGILSAKLVLMALMGSLYIAATPLSETKASVAWFLSPVPMLPAARVGVMMGLTLASISLFIDQYAETRAAVEARCLKQSRNPFRKAVFTLRPFLGNVFRRADQVAIAMEARCYTDEATIALRPFMPRDWITLAAIGVLTALLVVLRISL